MSEIVRVIRMHPEGSPETGMGHWNAVNHENIVSTDAKDRTYEVFNRALMEKSCVRVGIWEALPYEEKLINYPCNEFMYVIEGSCTVIEEDGNEEKFVEGESFFMPSGFNGYWKQEEPMKKYYMIVETARV